MTDLIAFIESVPLTVYALVAAVGLLLVVVGAGWRGERTG